MRSDGSPVGAAVRVAVWGVGAHAERRLLPALVGCEATTLVGLSTRNADRGARLAELHGCMFWPRPEQMLRATEVDAVLVATPIGCHYAQGVAVLEAGKHLWCEKSLSPSAHESFDLIAKARRCGAVLAEGFMFLYHPHFRQLEAVAAQLGAIISMTSRFLIPKLERPGFRHDRALGGGGLLDVGCYPVQAASALLGDGLEVVYARLVQPTDCEVDMLGHAVLISPSGAVALLEWGFGGAYRNDLTLCCATGSVDVDRVFSKASEHEPALVIRDGRGDVRVERAPSADSFVEMFRVLARAPHDEVLRERLYARAAAQAGLLERIRLVASLPLGVR